MEEIYNFEKLIDNFDRYSFYIEGKIERDIENNRKGAFIIEITDKSGNPCDDALVNVKQVSHEFNFGCSAFLLKQFPEEERNELYEKYFKKIFNYAVVPLYWDTLEPQKGKLRFEKDCENIYRRPALDIVMEFCRENNIRMKGHCLMYHSFNPDWIPDNHRELKIAVDKRLKEISERYGNDFCDVDVLNELHRKYKCLYGEAERIRNFPIADEKNHVAWCFDIAKKYFPFSTLFWNEGCYETFGKHYEGDKSYYYLMLKNHINNGVPVEGIGMQFHAFSDYENNKLLYNAVRQLDIFDLYSEFDLPIHLSEVSIPSYSNEEKYEEIQAELVKRMVTLWFSQKNINSVIWWNLVDGTAYEGENKFHAGLIRNDMTLKPAYRVLDELINKKWHTEFTDKTKNGMLCFNGFYGDYEIEVDLNGRKTVHKLSFNKDNTGYFHHIASDYGMRTKKIIIQR